MRVLNQTRNAVLVTDGQVAASMWARMRGLLGHAPLKTGEGLLLRGEKAIHTVGMSFPIDVLFLDRNGAIVHLIHSMVPSRFSPFVFRADDVLELPPGTLVQTGTVLGDQLKIDFEK